jgi:hypothetical protein
MSTESGRSQPGGLPSIVEDLRRAFPGSKLKRLPKVERGVFYLSKERREQWECCLTVARERRTEEQAAELIARASRLAFEHWIACRA